MLFWLEVYQQQEVMCLQQKNYNRIQHLKNILDIYNKKLHDALEIVEKTSAEVTEQKYLEGVNLLMERHQTSKQLKMVIEIHFATLPDSLKDETDIAVHKELAWLEGLIKKYQE